MRIGKNRRGGGCNARSSRETYATPPFKQIACSDSAVCSGYPRKSPPPRWGSIRESIEMTPSAVSLRIDNLANGLRSARPAVLFGLRLWAAVCLALYVAFWLELDNAYWAGTTAAIVSLPSLGASLRKAWFRMIGTVVGPKLRRLCRGARRSHRGDHRERRTRRSRGREWRGIHTRGHPRQRDLHWHPFRGRRAHRNRFGRRTASVG
jgi:hypothetical protein